MTKTEKLPLKFSVKWRNNLKERKHLIMKLFMLVVVINEVLIEDIFNSSLK